MPDPIFNYFFSVKDSCSQQVKSPPSKREAATSLIFGGTLVNGRKYPWAGAYVHNEIFQCGGNLGNEVAIIEKNF
jgi:hypothetical protein